MPLPELTHLQFLTMSTIGPSKRTGRELREAMAAEGATMSGPAFYQLMARLEEAKVVTGEYTQKIVEGQIIKERVYKLTGTGVRAVNDARDFYVRRGLVAAGRRGAANA